MSGWDSSRHGAVAQGGGAPCTGVTAGNRGSPEELGFPFVSSSAVPLPSPCANIGPNEATGGGSASPEALLSSQAPQQLQPCPGTLPTNCCAVGRRMGPGGANSLQGHTCISQTQPCFIRAAQVLKSWLGIKRKQGESYQLTSEH